MTDQTDIDARLAALLADRTAAPADQLFADRVLALAAHDLRVRLARRRAFAQVAREGLALAALLAAFVMLARTGPAAGFGDAVPATSPALLGVGILLLWGLVASRGPASLSS